MIKLGCNAMLPVAEDHRYPGKNDPRNWIDIAELVRMTRRLDLDIVDFQLFRGFRGKDPAYLRSIKGLCQQLGLPIGFLGVGGGFVGTEGEVGIPLPEPVLRQRIAEVKEGIDLAAFMSTPLVRLFAGSIPAESENHDGLWQTVVSSFPEVCDYAANKGIFCGLHNHTPVLAPTGDDVLKLLRDVDRENFTFILDTGCWPGSPGAAPPGATLPDIDFYAFMEETASAATYIRAKIYKIDSGQEELLDYERIVEIIRRADFNGNMSIVFEGHDNQCSDQEAIALAVKYLRKLLAS